MKFRRSSSRRKKEGKSTSRKESASDVVKPVAVQRKPFVRAASLSVGSFHTAISYDEEDDAITVLLDESEISKKTVRRKETDLTLPLQDDEAGASTSSDPLNDSSSGLFHESRKSAVLPKRTFVHPKKLPSEKILMGMIAILSEEEKEQAAESSYYYTSLRDDPYRDPQEAAAIRDAAAMQMAQRHWLAEDGNTELAMKKFKNSIQYRIDRRVSLIRSCFSENPIGGTPEEAKDMQRKIRKHLGPGKLLPRGYDKDGRCCFHFLARLSPESSKGDSEGCLESYFYIMEKSIACTERRTREMGYEYGEGPTNVVVSVDFEGFLQWHAPPMSVLKEMVSMLKDHYPERLHRVYMVDAPWICRGIWNMLKPFVDPETKTKFQFVTGLQGRKKVFDRDFGSYEQTMPYQQPEGLLTQPIDMENLYSLPFEVAHDDKSS